MVTEESIMENKELPPKYDGRENKEELLKRYRKMLFEPGEAIGVVAAQSISEPATQMTMETYHSAGAAKVSITQGLPRLIEIINARRNPKTPIMNIYLAEGHRTKEDAKEIAAKIKEVTLEDLVSEDTIDLTMLEMKFTINPEVLDEYRMDIDEVVDGIKGKYKVNIKTEDNVLTVTPSKDDYNLKDLQDIKAKIMTYRLHGYKNIEDVVILEEEGEWRVQTAGINLKKILRLDKVDSSRTVCNDIFKFKKVFGVEATRNLIYKEMRKTLDEQGMAVDDRWLLLIADTMTKDGDINGATRYGICGNKDSVFARSAFEETKKHITQAAIGGEIDPLESVVENIILGQVIPIGTGNLKLTAKPGKAPESVLKEIEEKRKKIQEEKQRMIDERREKEEKDEEEAALTEIDYEKLADMNISEIKELVNENFDEVDLEKLLSFEEENKNRKTMKKWIEEKMDS